MTGPETLILYTSGTLFLMATSARFLMKEAIAVVVLYKELKAAVGTKPRKKGAISQQRHKKSYSRRSPQKFVRGIKTEQAHVDRQTSLW